MSIAISKIILYNNGYATFFREGEFTGSTSIDLFFRKEDIEDVLKSISFSTEGGDSKVCSVSYQNTKQDASDALAIDIPNDYSLTGLLTALKGVKVSLGISGKTVEGILLGIETIYESDSEKKVVFVNIFQGIGVKSYPLMSLTSIDFLDANIQAEIQYSLKAALSQKNRDMLKVTVFTESSPNVSYKIKANYSLMAKEWVPSYRLELSDKVNDEGKNAATLDVFAVVNNTQEEDWVKVNMDIVSGVPPLPGRGGGSGLSGGAFPVTVKLMNSSSFTIRCDPNDTVEAIKKRIESSEGYPAAQQKIVFNGKQIETGRTLSDYNIRANSVLQLSLDRNAVSSSDISGTKPVFRLAETENLSFYNIDSQISVLRSQSALVPILKSNIEVTKILWYNETVRTGNPLSCIMFSNSTGYTLEKGTIVLKQKQITLGEAVLEQMRPKDEELYAYSVQLGVEVTVDVNTHHAKPHFIRVKNGELSIYSYKTQTTSYTFDNKTETNFPTVMLDHLFLDGWDLEKKNDEAPIDITDRYYRFEKKLGSKQKQKFEVSEKRVEIETFTLSVVNQEQVDKWNNVLKIMNPRLLDLCQQIIEINATISSLGSRIYTVESEMRECKDVQERLRKNITVLKNSQAGKYEKELAKEEDKLKQLEKDRKDLVDEKSTWNQKLHRTCTGVEYSGDVVPQKK